MVRAVADVRLNQSELRVLLESESGAVGKDLVRRGQRVLNRARETVPVDTGDLKGSLSMEIIKTGGDGLVARIGTNLVYGRYVNDGTKYMAPRPFLTRALEAARD